MKTTVLLSAGLFLATVSFAQTNVKSNTTIKGESNIENSKVTGNANASSETDIQSNSVSNAKQKSSAEIKKEHKAFETEEQSAVTKAKENGKKISTIASDKGSINAQGSEKGNLTSTIASDGNNQSDVHSNASAESKLDANATVKNRGYVKSGLHEMKHTAKKIETASANRIHSTVATAKGVKIKPVSIKTRANTGVGVNIK